MLTPLSVLQQYQPCACTLDSAFASRAQCNGTRPFLIFDGISWSWHAFRDAYLQLAHRLAARGVKAGDRIAIMADNHPAHLLLMFALARLRAIFVPINPAWGVSEARYALTHAAVSAVCCSSESCDVVCAATADIQPTPWLMRIEQGGVSICANALSDNTVFGPLPDPQPGDTFIILYTSGTTGFPKGVMHSQQSFVLAGERHIERVHLQPDDIALCVLPMFHNNALFNITASTVAAGGSLVLAPKFSASQFWRLVYDHGVTQVNVMAAVSTILARRPRSEYLPGHKLRVINGSGFTQETLDVFVKEFHVPKIIEGLGMTEIPGAFSIPFDAPYRLNCMGKLGKHPDHARPWTEARIVDDDGDDVDEGEIGELLVRIPTVMQGYWRDDAQTAATFRDGWFVTGDLVRRDTEGYYYHMGRTKDLIRRRGENISAAEIEHVLCEHPGVAEAAALPVPADIGEEEILTVCVIKTGWAPTARELYDWCASKLAAFKAPRYVAFVDALPHTPTHKVAKHLLKMDRSALLASAVDVRKPD
jgi:crotonobetaine/carnitine-CoA ligase